MGIESFADSGSDIGLDVQEVPDSDVDFGDGDGVNEFDEDYNEMKMEDGAPFEFDEEISEETSEGRGEQNRSCLHLRQSNRNWKILMIQRLQKK